MSDVFIRHTGCPDQVLQIQGDNSLAGNKHGSSGRSRLD